MEFNWRRWAKRCADRADRADVESKPSLIEQYLSQHPTLDQPGTVARLVDQEYRVRQQFADRPPREEYRRRFPFLDFSVRCPDITTLENQPDALRAESAARAERTNVNTDALLEPTGSSPALADYQVIREIGRGGMGIVYEANQKSLSRRVALKLLPSNDADAAQRSRLIREARAVAKLDHPHIVPVYDVGEDDGRTFFSMKLIEGSTLARRIADGPIPSRQAAKLLLPIAWAVSEAHRNELLHRDLKPSNILMNSEGQPFVADFGLARSFDGGQSFTASGQIEGTPAYMSPEQALGANDRLCAASDIFSLGAMLFEMLTGERPFVADSAIQIIKLIVEEDPSPPSSLRPDVDRTLEVICMKCLQKAIDLRYATAEELAEDLQAFLADEPIKAARFRPAEILSRTLRETHHAKVLENWGPVWMFHGCAMLVLLFILQGMVSRGFTTHAIHAAVFFCSVPVWGAAFWYLRSRAGPVVFVERQITHVWIAANVACTATFVLEACLDLPIYTLAPLFAVAGCSIFLAKAGILSGTFYLYAAAYLCCAAVMFMLPDYSMLLLGLVTWAAFFVPGWRQMRRAKPSNRR